MIVEPTKTANLLIEALPYIQQFAGKTIVVKYGGNALAGATDDDALGAFTRDLMSLNTTWRKPSGIGANGSCFSG